MTGPRQKRIAAAGRARPGRPKVARTGSHRNVFLLMGFVWAIGATWIAVSNHLAVLRLQEEQTALRAAHEDKVRALVRRLVGVASHQVLEQDGLAGRLADIITRQVELENRQASLTVIANKMAGEEPPAAAAPQRSGERPADPMGDAQRSPSIKEPAPAPGRERKSLLDEGADPVGDRISRTVASLPVRDQFARIEASLGRVETGQVHVLAGLIDGTRRGIVKMRSILTELDLPAAAAAAASRPLSDPTPPRLPAGAPADSFAAAMIRADEAFAEAARWRAVVTDIPLMPPLDGGGGLTSNFGMRRDPFTGAPKMHAGMDFRAAIGTPVRTAGNGRVITAGISGGYGNLVEIDHGHDLVTRYGHLSAINVQTEQIVTAGTVVGLIGSTGRSTGPHLHYETRIAGSAVDPARFLRAGLKLYSQLVPTEAPTEIAATDSAD